MVNKKSSERGAGFFDSALIFLFIILCVIVLGVLAYFFYINIPGNPENLVFDVGRTGFKNISYTEAKQFYPNMKFNHNTISYNIDAACEEEKKQRVKNAFIKISDEVEVINFIEKPDSVDILVLCSESEKSSSKENYFIAGEGGAREIIQTGKYNVITEGVVLLYGDKNTLKCSEPKVEIHEIMHVLGFNHSENPGSIMYPVLESCDQDLDDSIINELKRIYSEDNLPELYFDEVIATKKGRYLDFNITIRNAGDIDAKGVSYAIFDDGEIAEIKNIGDIRFGAGIAVHVENFKLIHRDPSEIKFVIDNENKIREFDKENNVAVVKLG